MVVAAWAFGLGACAVALYLAIDSILSQAND